MKTVSLTVGTCRYTDRYISTVRSTEVGVLMLSETSSSIFTDGYADGVVNDPSPQLGVLATRG